MWFPTGKQPPGLTCAYVFAVAASHTTPFKPPATKTLRVQRDRKVVHTETAFGRVKALALGHGVVESDWTRDLKRPERTGTLTFLVIECVTNRRFPSHRFRGNSTQAEMLPKRSEFGVANDMRCGEKLLPPATLPLSPRSLPPSLFS